MTKKILFIDGGSNLGQSLVGFTIFLDKTETMLSDCTLDAYCIEPSIDPKIKAGLKEVIRNLTSSRDYSSVTLFQSALSSSNEPLKFWDYRQSGSTTVKAKAIFDPTSLKPKLSTTYLKALVRLARRIFVEKPRIVSSISLETLISLSKMYEEYYLKVDIEGGEYNLFTDEVRSAIKSRPPKKIFIEYHAFKSGHNFCQTNLLNNCLSSICSVETWECDSGKYAEPVPITSDYIFNLCEKDVTEYMNISLKRPPIAEKLFRRLCGIETNSSLYNRSLKSTVHLWRKEQSASAIKQDLLKLERKTKVLSIDRSLLLQQLDQLRYKYKRHQHDLVYTAACCDNRTIPGLNYSGLNSLNLQYYYTSNADLLLPEIGAINKVVLNQLQNNGIDFLYAVDFQLRQSCVSSCTSHTLRWHRDYNGFYVIKAFIPLDKSNTSGFLDYLPNTHRKFGKINYFRAHSSRSTISNKEYETTSPVNIDIINTSSIHREKPGIASQLNLIITYLTHPNYNE